jgi:ATP-dependent Clp protease protease subunit
MCIYKQYITFLSCRVMFVNKMKSNIEEEELKLEVPLLNIKVINNTIYFYEDISIESVLCLCNHLRKLEIELLKLQIEYNLTKPPYIYLHIQSYGGDAYPGLSAMNTIEACRVPVITIVDGFVASAATFMLLAGKERWMQANSTILIHQIRGEFWGRYDELKDEMSNSIKLMRDIRKIYKNKTNMNDSVLKKIISKERVIYPRKCMKYGIVTKII